MDTRFTLYTDLPKEKQDLAEFLSIADISKAEGFKLITDKLDEIYLWDLNIPDFQGILLL